MTSAREAGQAVTDRMPDIDLGEALRNLKVSERLSEIQERLGEVQERIGEADIPHRLRDVTTSVARVAPPAVSARIPTAVSARIPAEKGPSLLRRLAVPLGLAALVGGILMARRWRRHTQPSDPLEPQSAVPQPSVSHSS